MTTQTHASAAVPDTLGSGTGLTVLGVLTDGWTWRTHPDDQQLPATEPQKVPSESVDRQLVRALAWSRILPG